MVYVDDGYVYGILSMELYCDVLRSWSKGESEHKIETYDDGF